MNFDLKIQNNELTVLCSNSLEKFFNKFIKYYDENIERIKEELSIIQIIKNQNLLINCGNTVLNTINESYIGKSK